MAKNIPFKVAHATSQDDERTIDELMAPGPSSRGWASGSYPIFPQVSFFNQFEKKIQAHL